VGDGALGADSGRWDHIISYRKGPYAPWEPEAFEPGPITINGQEYAWRPALREVQIPVYEKVPAQEGKPVTYRRTRRVLTLREVRLRRATGGQTSILTSRQDLSAEQIVALQLARWGDQENQFKYLRREFDLDSMWMYGTEPIAAEVQHPNPPYTALQAQLRRLIQQRQQLLDRLWSRLPAAPPAEQEAAARERLEQWLHATGGQGLAELNRLEAQIAAVREQQAQIPARESVSQGAYAQLKTESKRLSNLIKLEAEG
jgi:hypothetical protein